MHAEFQLGAWRVQPQLNSLSLDQTTIRLEPKMMSVLVCLAERSGHVVPKEQLVQEVWPDTFVTDDVLIRCVSGLRKAFGDDAGKPAIIETIPKNGYRLLLPVVPVTYSQHPQGASRAELAGSIEDGELLGFKTSPSPKPDEQSISAQGTISRRGFAIATLLTLLSGAVLILIGLTRAPLPRVVESHALTNDGLPKYSLTTDGARLYFVRKVAGKPILSEMSVQGGDVAEIKVPFQYPVVYDIAADRSALLVGGEFREKAKELWIVPIPAGAPHRVGDFLVNGASWSPDGIHIAYVRGHDLYLARSDGSDQRSLGTMAGYPATPRFSPTGNRIRFGIYDTSANLISIWEIGIDGKQPRRAATNASEQAVPTSTCCGIWSADGNYFFYTTILVNQHMGQDIWISSDAGGAFTSASERLTSGPLGFESVTPSTDGKKLFAVGTQARMELLRLDATSNAFQPFLGGISATDVEISRDGQWATYVSYPERTLWRSRIDGRERMQLTFAPTEAFRPRWSPDGGRIAFTDLRPGSRARVFVVSRGGGIPAPILPRDDHNEIDPSWLPDGKSIIFARTHLDPDLAIFEVDIATGELRMLPGSQNLTGPLLSPDGRYLSALSRDWMSLMLYDTRTEQWQQLRTADSLGIGYCNWSNDARWLYYRIGRTVARTRMTDRRTEQVVDLSSISEPNPSWIGLAQDNSILLDRDNSAHDIYALTLSSSR